MTGRSFVKPEWLRKQAGIGSGTLAVRELVAHEGIATVCQEARCPNLGECFSRKVATFMILGDICTRACGFCAVATGAPALPDPAEPDRIARAAEELGLAHVVITSVNRDDLPDGGAGHFADTIAAIRERLPQATIEILTPDFLGDRVALQKVLAAKPEVFNHNMETVPALYPKVRAGASYDRSLEILAEARKGGAGVTKSGLMLGFGESDDEVLSVFDDLCEVGISVVTLGQYLQPSKENLPVAEYVAPERFARLRRLGRERGIPHLFAGPYVRSSYHAAEIFSKQKSLTDR